MAPIRYAKDEKCSVCGKPAVTFWPCIDPDIQSFPYCRKCVEEQKTKLLVAFCEEVI